MAGTAVLGRLSWQVAEVVDVVEETPRVKTVRFEIPGWAGHRAGQHVDVRLTAEDGYQAQRSYSIASSPDGTQVELTVERLEDGEVSPYLTDVLRPGDQIELRGPIGGYFVWEPPQGGPLLLVAGGLGRRAADGDDPAARGGPVAKHRHQRHHAGAARHEEQRPAVASRIPGEVAP